MPGDFSSAGVSLVADTFDPPPQSEQRAAVSDRALEMVDALSVAWSTYALYADPRGQDAFSRAVQILASAPAYPWRVEVGVEGFIAQGHRVPSRRDAARRMARRVFAHGGAAIEILGPPTADELIGLFAFLTVEPGGGDATDGLRAAGVESIVLLPFELLLREAEVGASEAETAVWCTGYEGDVEPFVHALLAEMPDDPAGVATRFLGEYERLFGMTRPDDHWALEEVVHTFVDAASFLPQSHQTAVLEHVLERQDHPGFLVFLDQMAGEELGDLSRHLAPQAHPLLIEYARIAAEQGEVHHGELLRLLPLVDGPKSVGQTVTEEVRSVLDGGNTASAAAGSLTALGRLQAMRPTDEDGAASATNVLRGLLDLVRTTGEFRSVAAVWADKVTQAVVQGDLEAADVWLTAAGGLGLGSDELATMRLALAACVTPDAVAQLVAALRHDGEDRPAVLDAAPYFAVQGLVGVLEAPEREDDHGACVAALESLGPHLPEVLATYLGHRNWLVVLAVVRALGGSVRAELAPRLRSCLIHFDHRVRREALRSLVRLEGSLDPQTLLRALDDEHVEVRGEAIGLGGRVISPDLDGLLIARLASGSGMRERHVALAALAARSTPEARRAVRRCAARRFAVGAKTKALRTEARRLLARTNGGRDE